MSGIKIQGGTLIRKGGTRTDMRAPPQSQPNLAGKDLAENNRVQVGNQVGSIWQEARYLADR